MHYRWWYGLSGIAVVVLVIFLVWILSRVSPGQDFLRVSPSGNMKIIPSTPVSPVSEELLRGLASVPQTATTVSYNLPLRSPFSATQAIVFGSEFRFLRSDQFENWTGPLVECSQTPAGDEQVLGMDLIPPSSGILVAPVEIAWIVQRSASQPAIAFLDLRILPSRDSRRVEIKLIPENCISNTSSVASVTPKAGQLVVHRSEYNDPDKKGNVVLMVEMYFGSQKTFRTARIELSSQSYRAAEKLRGVMPGAKTIQVGPAYLTVMPGQ